MASISAESRSHPRLARTRTEGREMGSGDSSWLDVHASSLSGWRVSPDNDPRLNLSICSRAADSTTRRLPKEKCWQVSAPGRLVGCRSSNTQKLGGFRDGECYLIHAVSVVDM